MEQLHVNLETTTVQLRMNYEKTTVVLQMVTMVFYTILRLHLRRIYVNFFWPLLYIQLANRKWRIQQQFYLSVKNILPCSSILIGRKGSRFVSIVGKVCILWRNQ